MSDVLRVIDFGRVSPLRSQTLWHAVCYGVSEGAPATLSLARPSAPYVCLGYHRDPAEVDREYCGQAGLPVYRRMVGGGPVYLDDQQLFFQICVPAGAVSPSRRDALRSLLEPAVAAFRAAGVPAVLDGEGEICVGDRKICGHGAGQIEGAVVVCGNLIEAFDHDTATRVLALPDAEQRAQTLALMRRYVAATPANPEVFARALASAYGSALGLPARPGELTAAERDKVCELDLRFTAPDWLAGPARARSAAARSSAPGGAGPGSPGPGGPGARGPGPARAATAARHVKVRAGVWTFAASASGGTRVVASVVNGTIDAIALTAPGRTGQARQAELALAGAPVRSAAQVLERFGDEGRELAQALTGAQGRL